MNNFVKDFMSFKGMSARNIKVYLKNRMAIIFSMITPIIVLGLYLLFLKDTYVSSIEDIFGMLKESDIDAIVNSWLIAGVLGTAVVTVALNSLTVMVNDKEKKLHYDYIASPVKNHIVMLSYFTGAVINTIIVCSILMGVGLLFLAITDSFYLNFIDILSMFGIVVLGSVSATIVLMLFGSFFTKSSTLSSFSVLVSAGIGFVIGAYMPVSQFSDTMQNIINMVPGSHIAGLLRNTIMQPVLDSVAGDYSSIAAVDEAMAEMFSLKLQVFGEERDIQFMLIYSAIAIALFFILNIIAYAVNTKRKDA